MTCRLFYNQVLACLSRRPLPSAGDETHYAYQEPSEVTLNLGIIRLFIRGIGNPARAAAGHCWEAGLFMPGLGSRKVCVRIHVHVGGNHRPWFRLRSLWCGTQQRTWFALSGYAI